MYWKVKKLSLVFTKLAGKMQEKKKITQTKEHQISTQPSVFSDPVTPKIWTVRKSTFARLYKKSHWTEQISWFSGVQYPMSDVHPLISIQRRSCQTETWQEKLRTSYLCIHLSAPDIRACKQPHLSAFYFIFLTLTEQLTPFCICCSLAEGLCCDVIYWKVSIRWWQKTFLQWESL